MGQGQEIHARRLLSQSFEDGGWLLLQNCHLGLDYMDELLENVSTAQAINPLFKCWITTEPHPHFPINLLQASIKFTAEPPQGLRAGLKRTYNLVTQETLELSNMFQWKPMLFTTAFLHSVVQEKFTIFVCDFVHVRHSESVPATQLVHGRANAYFSA
jgi:dynein heavy chain